MNPESKSTLVFDKESRTFTRTNVLTFNSDEDLAFYCFEVKGKYEFLLKSTENSDEKARQFFEDLSTSEDYEKMTDEQKANIHQNIALSIHNMKEQLDSLEEVYGLIKDLDLSEYKEAYDKKVAEVQERRNKKEQETNTSEQETNTSEQETNTSEQETNTSEQETNTSEQVS